MLRYTIIMASLLTISSAQAQMSLSDQIAAVRQAQDAEQARQDAAQRFAVDQAARQASQQRAAAAAAEQQQRAAAIAAEQQQRAAAFAIEQQKISVQNKIIDEAVADKKREQSYEDQLRTVEVDHARLRLLDEQQKLTSDKKRDQAYEDRLRDLEVQAKLLELKRAEVRVSRENDVIDHELRREDSQTDVVQSGADATRNVSEGAKSFMQHVGDAGPASHGKPEVSQIIIQ